MLVSKMFTHGEFWLVLGFVGQFFFFMRFFVQWMASEKAKKSVMPVAFWFFSIFGGGILFAYAIYKQDPVFIVGQGAGLLIYVRNLMLIRKEYKRSQEAATHESYFI
jgi:lipid-A-disaccharide synthase-like uncharacterized protein